MLNIFGSNLRVDPRDVSGWSELRDSTAAGPTIRKKRVSSALVGRTTSQKRDAEPKANRKDFANGMLMVWKSCSYLHYRSRLCAATGGIPSIYLARLIVRHNAAPHL
jgi:hypothetical protein